MTWFTPTDRKNHPCDKPEPRREDWGKFWRCEVCDDLFRVRAGYVTGLTWERAGWWDRWRYRHEGRSEEN
jgi:uncharacterized C2H2 Zn-finger protein